MGIIAVILWVIILTIFLISALNEVGLASVIGPAVVAVLLVFIGLVVYQFAKARRWANRLNDAWEQFLIRRDVERYFSELDALEKLNGGRPIGKMQAKEYFACQRISALKSAGRKEQAYALLETALQEATSDRAILVLTAEKTHWS
ncbi:hypothetical protein [uncultured Flavonifractor sp.]|uniref:hypothetical protein n=1 Tax=uncultured Flavonifractor sp. TaxID=1193534 RepID=UPI00261EA516|nr:hypothetical protein [uncultured Flavonifractor sp.]